MNFLTEGVDVNGRTSGFVDVSYLHSHYGMNGEKSAQDWELRVLPKISLIKTSPVFK